MKIILGIDPALNNVGYGILFYDERNDCIVDIKYGIFDINSKHETEDKLNVSFTTTQSLIDMYEIDEVALEKAFHNPKTAKGGFLVREAIGALKVAIVQKHKPLYFYTPQRIKKDITGSGSAEKIDVAKGIAELLNLPNFVFEKRIRNKMELISLTPEELVKKKLDHITDALAIANCRLLEIKSLKEAV